MKVVKRLFIYGVGLLLTWGAWLSALWLYDAGHEVAALVLAITPYAFYGVIVGVLVRWLEPEVWRKLRRGEPTDDDWGW
ncbi:MAG: hypothetical protein QW838_04280 [Candidatus Nitrosotenuis sp.]